MKSIQIIMDYIIIVHPNAKIMDYIIINVCPYLLNGQEKTLNMEMSGMIGIGLYQLQFANNDELDITRRKMVA